MTQRPDSYSQGVKIAKYVLPVIAIGLFVSIFAQSNNDAIRSGKILTTSEMQDLAVDQKITKPRFAGLTHSGDAFTLEADEAFQMHRAQTELIWSNQSWKSTQPAVSDLMPTRSVGP